MAIRSILASLNGNHGDIAVLETAALAHKALGAWVDCLHVTYDFGADEKFLAYSLGPARALPSERIRALDADFAEKSRRARETYDSFCNRHRLDTRPGDRCAFSYSDARGGQPDETVREARYRDLTIIGREAPNNAFSIEKLGAVVMGCGRGVLISPQKSAASFGQNIVIAWKDTPEAAHAVTAAMPILAGAKQISVVTTPDERAQTPAAEASINALAAQLRRHGLAVGAKLLPFDSHAVHSRILDHAYAIEADLLVMGGYGHGRLREYVFGGLTREILSDCDLPVLMTH